MKRFHILPLLVVVIFTSGWGFFSKKPSGVYVGTTGNYVVDFQHIFDFRENHVFFYTFREVLTHREYGKVARTNKGTPKYSNSLSINGVNYT